MTATAWWHAFGRVRDDLGGCWQLVIISPSGTPPEEVKRFASGREVSWGDYLTSWDHEPSEAEKDAVTPAVYRDDGPPE